MILHDVGNVQVDFPPKLPMEMEPVEEHLSTDTRLLLFRQLDEELQLTREFATQLVDTRTDPTHSTLEMVRSRLFGIIAGHEDQHDHDALRSDAGFTALAHRCAHWPAGSADPLRKTRLRRLRGPGPGGVRPVIRRRGPVVLDIDGTKPLDGLGSPSRRGTVGFQCRRWARRCPVAVGPDRRREAVRRRFGTGIQSAPITLPPVPGW